MHFVLYTERMVRQDEQRSTLFAASKGGGTLPAAMAAVSAGGGHPHRERADCGPQDW
jgi:hypothetical protein